MTRTQAPKDERNCPKCGVVRMEQKTAWPIELWQCPMCKNVEVLAS